jgi:hypothetical protein
MRTRDEREEYRCFGVILSGRLRGTRWWVGDPPVSRPTGEGLESQADSSFSHGHLVCAPVRQTAPGEMATAGEFCTRVGES